MSKSAKVIFEELNEVAKEIFLSNKELSKHEVKVKSSVYFYVNYEWYPCSTMEWFMEDFTNAVYNEYRWMQNNKNSAPKEDEIEEPEPEKEDEVEEPKPEEEDEVEEPELKDEDEVEEPEPEEDDSDIPPFVITPKKMSTLKMMSSYESAFKGALQHVQGGTKVSRRLRNTLIDEFSRSKYKDVEVKRHVVDGMFIKIYVYRKGVVDYENDYLFSIIPAEDSCYYSWEVFGYNMEDPVRCTSAMVFETLIAALE